MATVTGVIAIVEILAFVGLWFVFGGLVSYDFLQGERAGLIGEGPSRVVEDQADEPKVDRRFQVEQALHPFMGYVADPEEDRHANAAGNDERSTEFGFPYNKEDFFAPRAEDEVVVAILGGSVAYFFAHLVADLLAVELNDVERFAGKKIRVISLALPGYKQPQQLMALTYFLNLGVDIDVVLNIDGFNEVALPQQDNLRFGTFPFYPRAWKTRVASSDPALLGFRGRVMDLRERRRQRAAAFSDVPWRYSFVASLLWKVLDLRADRELHRVELELQRKMEGAHDSERQGDYFAEGPSVEYASDDEMYESFAQFWAKSSRLMAGLCASQGIEYHHFLQPNQYVANSKALTDEERLNAWQETHPYRVGAEQGYPKLRAHGESLSAEGVHFVSLVDLFADHRETLYRDACCHFNLRGNELMAHAVVAALVDSLPGNNLE